MTPLLTVKEPVWRCDVQGWIYPIGAHWEWGADGWLLKGQQYPSSVNNTRAKLDDNGNYYYVANYQDFAGSGVVHILGAFSGLAAMLVLGPRRGLKRTFTDEPAEKPTPHSLPVNKSNINMCD